MKSIDERKKEAIAILAFLESTLAQTNQGESLTLESQHLDGLATMIGLVKDLLASDLFLVWLLGCSRAGKPSSVGISC